MPLAAINGLNLYYEEAGSGPPLLLIAGLSGTTLGWAMLLPALAAHFRVIAFDNRGAGRSSAPPGPYTTRQMAGDAAALLEHLGITRAHVIGLSLGGMIAQELALAHPERVDHLVLYATYARPRMVIHAPWFQNWAQASERGDTPDQSLADVVTACVVPDSGVHGTPETRSRPSHRRMGGRSLPSPCPWRLAAQAAACLSHDTHDHRTEHRRPDPGLVGAEEHRDTGLLRIRN